MMPLSLRSTAVAIDGRSKMTNERLARSCNHYQHHQHHVHCFKYKDTTIDASISADLAVKTGAPQDDGVSGFLRALRNAPKDKCGEEKDEDIRQAGQNGE